MIRISSVVLAAAILGASLSGCRQRVGLFGEPASRYHDLLGRATRGRSFYGLDRIPYQTNVTFKSRALREAYVEEYARVYGLTPEQKEEERARQSEEAERYDVFFVAHYSTEKDAARIAREPGVWRLTLAAGGNPPAEPDSVTALPARDTVLRYFYPYVTPWSKAFLVKFKRPAGGSPLVLRMTGVVADLDFEWKNAGEPAP